MLFLYHANRLEDLADQLPNNLGVMYANGRGVREDSVYAHIWFSISALNGNENGSKSRDIVEKQ